jgi:hypothetical protein
MNAVRRRLGAVMFSLIVFLSLRATVAQGIEATAGQEKVATPTGNTAAADKAFPAIRARIAAALVGDAWLKKDWKPNDLQADLSRILEEANAASGRKDLKAPVEFADVAPAPLRAGGPPVLKGGLLVAREVEFAFADNSIVLATGSIRISHASNCVFIAGGAVNVDHCRNSVVVAGSWIQMAFDGDPGAMRAARAGGPPVPPNASLLLAGGVINVSHLNGSVCAANTVRVSHTSGSTFLGVRSLAAEHAQQVIEVKDAKLPSAPQPQPNPLRGKVTIVQVVEPRDDGKGALAIAHIRGGPEVVIRPGQPIRDGNGEPDAELKGWTLSFVGNGLALFTKEESGDFAMFDLKAPPDLAGPAALAL